MRNEERTLKAILEMQFVNHRLLTEIKIMTIDLQSELDAVAVESAGIKATTDKVLAEVQAAAASAAQSAADAALLISSLNEQLQAALANGTPVTPAIVDAVAAIHASNQATQVALQVLDTINADEVVTQV
jgi:hypothetical protein